MIWLQRGLLVLTLVFAAATVFLALKIQEVPLPDEFELPNRFSTPILAMEFPRDAADLAFVQGLENEDMRRHIFVVQYIDQYFPWAYGGLLAAFLAFAMVLLLQRFGKTRLGIFLMVPLWAFTTFSVINSDFVENERINGALPAVMDQDQASSVALDRHAESITMSAWAKWTLIAAAFALISVLLVANGNRVIGALFIIPLAATLYARFIDPTGPAIEFMAQAIAVFFLAIPLMAVYFLVQSFRRTEPAHESPRQVES